jgi:hypothetical protein
MTISRLEITLSALLAASLYACKHEQAHEKQAENPPPQGEGTQGAQAMQGNPSSGSQRSGFGDIDVTKADAYAMLSGPRASAPTGVVAFNKQSGGTKLDISLANLGPGQYSVDLADTAACPWVAPTGGGGEPPQESYGRNPSESTTEPSGSRDTSRSADMGEGGGAYGHGGTGSSNPGQSIGTQGQALHLGELTVSNEGHGRLQKMLSAQELGDAKSLENKAVIVRPTASNEKGAMQTQPLACGIITASDHQTGHESEAPSS